MRTAMTRQHALPFFFAMVFLSATLAAVAGPPSAAVETFQRCHGCPEMVIIPAGSFTMGAAPAELARIRAAGGLPPSRSPEGPQHRVHVNSFAAGSHAVTRGEFAAFVKATRYKTNAENSDDGCLNSNGLYEPSNNWRQPGNIQADDHPVVCVSWNDAQAYVQWLSQETGKPYRLPSEAEREYATRGGSGMAYWFGEKITLHQANINNNPAMNGSPLGRQSTLPVNSFKPNPFGLYNVHGNVWEWVADCYHDRYTGAPVDGSAWTRDCTSADRMLRGGSWVSGPLKASSAYRVFNGEDRRASDIGFRVAMTLVP
ncbi:formylglycine-generating enzyme family protein [Polaromonas sp. SM01]|uniref:formylglycine-generating enzyme family protein n=1 Tax=Polaromonas sp. SM01 TaxID=3085630 RepID=UPI002981AE13|nr:formylglycine-generating enzyme family protein [Polaromonas sp. SM01]MDW5443387.1 formylglycine-generating enzyme family protein [Polaromonas sp. SM01]